MEIRLTPEHEATLIDLARLSGKAPHEIASEALARFLDDQAWVSDARAKIEEGWLQSERGDVVDGETSKRRLAARHAEILEKIRP